MNNYISYIIFVGAAILEISGDAIIRKGLRTSGFVLVVLGFVILGCYGIVVNSVKWDFSKLIGVYVGIFATVSIIVGRFFFKENIPASTWIGLIVIIIGGIIIQFGPK